MDAGLFGGYMVKIEEQIPRAEAWVWFKENVLRYFKPTISVVGLLAATGNMGRDLIEGIEWLVWIVDVYHYRLGVPVAEVLESLFQVPIIWIASRFDIVVSLPDFPPWGVDIIVLANIASGFLLFQKFLTIPAQIFAALALSFSLSLLFYSTQLFQVLGYPVTLLLFCSASYFTFVSMLTQQGAIESSMKEEYNLANKESFHPDYVLDTDTLSLWDTIVNFLDLTVEMFRIPFVKGNTYSARKMVRTIGTQIMGVRSTWRMLLVYSFFLALGFFILLLNQYADVALPPLERALVAIDAMIQDWMTWLAGDR